MKNNLTLNQKKAITTLDQSMVLSAGAGAGKTEVLTRRVIKILENKREPSVLAITFTKKASAEMKSRIYKEVSSNKQLVKKLDRVKIQTIDSFCSDLIREYAPYLNISPNFKVMEEGESAWQLKKIVRKEIRKSYKEDQIFQKLLEEWEYDFFQIESQVFELYIKLRQNGQVQSFDFINQGLSSEDKSLIFQEIKSILIFFREAYKSRRTNFQKLLKSPRGEVYFSKEEIDCESLEFLNDLLKEIGKIEYEEEKKKEFQKKMLELKKEEEKNNQDYIASIRKLLLTIERNFWQEKKSLGLMDFADLLEKSLYLVEDSFIQKDLIKLYDYILVDEFQDTNKMQIKLVSVLARNANLFLVGDKKQSIYGFRGSDVRSSLKASQKMKEEGATLLTLVENFRSSPTLMDYINTFFEKRMEGYVALKGCGKSDTSEFGVVNLIGEKSKNREEGIRREAEFIARKVKKLWKEDSNKTMALLVRTRSKLDIYEEVFRLKKIPFINRKSKGFFETREIKDLMIVLYHLFNPSDPISYLGFLRSPFVGFKEETIYKVFHSDSSSFTLEERNKMDEIDQFYTSLQEGTASRGVLSLIEEILYEKSYLSYVEEFGSGRQGVHNLLKFLDMAQVYDEEEARGLAGFIQWIEKKREYEDISQADIPSSKSCLEISTIHGSKGLQYDVVFIGDLSGSGKNDTNRFNYSYKFGAGINREYSNYTFLENKILSNQFEEEENLRLFYVAMTRAKSHLYILKSCESKKGFMPFIQDQEEMVIDLQEPKMEEADSLTSKKKTRKTPPIFYRKEKKPLYSPSKILQKYSEGITNPVDFKVSQSKADRLGTFLHQYAAHAYKPNHLLKDAILDVVEEELNKEDKERLNSLIDKYDQSLNLGEKILATEIPFYVELENFYLQGVFDQLREVNGELHLLDIKTGKNGAKTPFLDKYKMQLKLYGESWKKVHGTTPVLEIFFLEDGQRIKVDPMTPKEEDDIIKNL